MYIGAMDISQEATTTTDYGPASKVYTQYVPFLDVLEALSDIVIAILDEPRT